MGEHNGVMGWFGWVVFRACMNVGDVQVFEALFHIVIKRIVSCDVACPIGVATFAWCFEAVENGDGAGVGQKDEVGMKADFGIAECAFVGVGDDGDFGASPPIFCICGVWFWIAEVFGKAYLIVFCECLIAKDEEAVLVKRIL